jgi:hypothetical protein
VSAGRGFVRASVVAVAMLVAACGLAPSTGIQISVEAETMPWADLTAYRTYAWWMPSAVDRHAYTDRGEREAKIDWRIRSAIDVGLAGHGFVPDPASPDFIVSYRVSIVEDHTSSFQEYAAYRAQGGTKGLGDAYMGYRRGVLRIEIRDATTQRVAWRGTATAIADGSGRRIEPAVQQILARLPAVG